MAEIEGLIRFWESKLKDRYLLEPSVISIIESTIGWLKKVHEYLRKVAGG